MSLTRRRLMELTLGAAMVVRPVAALATPLPREADIVVIGAGAAGIAAARRIAAAGRRVVVIEATGAVGGRCQTDVTAFDQPFDRGARWLYNPDSNPVVKLARGAGMDIAPVPQGQKIRIGERNARAGESEDFLATLVRTNRAIDDASRRGDIACATVLPKDLGDWAGTTEFLLGAFGSGKDLNDLSVGDESHGTHRDAAVAVRQGLGALIAKLSEGLPIALSTPVTRVAWGNRDASVETPMGTITARAVILTASTNILTSGKIKFTPDLPKRQLDAATKLSLGSRDHIVLELPGNPLGLSRDDAFIEQSRDTRTGILYANIAGTTLCSVDVGGSFGRDLSARGEAAMVSFATEWLTKLFGNDVASVLKRHSATRWDAAPYVLGAMSAASPGGASGRRALAEPLGALLLAGEATHETDFGTVGGAWDSGERAADAALKRVGTPVGALRDSEPSKPARRRAPASSQGVTRAPGLSWPRT